MARTRGGATRGGAARGDSRSLSLSRKPRSKSKSKPHQSWPLPTLNFDLFNLNFLDLDFKHMRQSLRNSIANGGSLYPVISLLGGGQLQTMLLAWIPIRYGSWLNTGIYAVDMFVTTFIVTALVAALSFIGTSLQLYIETDPTGANQNNPISVKIEHFRMDKYGEYVVNLHYEAMAWLISQRSRDERFGDFRMVPSNCNGDKDPNNYWDSDDDVDSSAVPDFNILPRGDLPLIIDHEKCKFLIKFEQPTAEEETNDNAKPVRAPEERRKPEPPIIIQRALKEEEEEAEEAEGDNEELPEPSIEFMQNVLNQVTKLYLEHQHSRKCRARYERYRGGGWYWSSEIHACRGLGSVALDKVQEDLLKRDLESFHEDKEFYVRMGLPYTRGYLFSGKPGTGKTSLINAISATYNRDLYYMNLKEVSDDAALQSAFNSVPKNAIIVFEDVDAQSAVVHSRERRFALRNIVRAAEAKRERERKEAKERDRIRKKLKKEAKKKREEAGEDPSESEEEDEAVVPPAPTFFPQEMEDTEDASSVIGMAGDIGGGVGFGDLKLGKMGGFGSDGFGASSLLGGFTLSTLLNCLDGHTLAEGTIIIMSTNHPEVLDPALIRPGRIDLHLNLGYCTRYQLRSMYRSVMDNQDLEPDFSKVPDHVIAPCDAMRIMVLYRHTPDQIPLQIYIRTKEILNERGISSPSENGEDNGEEVVPPLVEGEKSGDGVKVEPGEKTADVEVKKEEGNVVHSVALGPEHVPHVESHGDEKEDKDETESEKKSSDDGFEVLHEE